VPRLVIAPGFPNFGGLRPHRPSYTCAPCRPFRGASCRAFLRRNWFPTVGPRDRTCWGAPLTPLGLAPARESARRRRNRLRLGADLLPQLLPWWSTWWLPQMERRFLQAVLAACSLAPEARLWCQAQLPCGCHQRALHGRALAQ